jgi:hypothetical protein
MANSSRLFAATRGSVSRAVAARERGAFPTASWSLIPSPSDRAGSGFPPSACDSATPAPRPSPTRAFLTAVLEWRDRVSSATQGCCFWVKSPCTIRPTSGGDVPTQWSTGRRPRPAAERESYVMSLGGRDTRCTASSVRASTPILIIVGSPHFPGRRDEPRPAAALLTRQLLGSSVAALPTVEKPQPLGPRERAGTGAIGQRVTRQRQGEAVGVRRH